jgi:hypothetical protein
LGQNGDREPRIDVLRSGWALPAFALYLVAAALWIGIR